MAQKKTIYYSRTYRRIHTNFLHAFVYIFLLVLPALILLITHLEEITLAMSRLTVKVLQGAMPWGNFAVKESGFVPFGLTYCVELDGRFPTPNELLINLIVVTVIIGILVTSGLRGRPITVYLLFSFMVHIISCVYFIFIDDYFVYTATDFSDIFIKQQVSIWILFVVMMGIITAFVGTAGVFYKIAAFFAVMIYSTVFGVIRYIVFMFILSYFSILYMADMYFVTGPIFDFLYLVSIYSIYSDRIQKRLDSPEGEDEWAWL